MRIEVLVGSEEPVIYPLSNNKISIGTGEQCDVVIVANSISRKHLVISFEDDKFFVTDQGSTNGTFINEERLSPGRKTEFTCFFPVRLGDNVLISLLSDEEAPGDLIIPIPVQEKPQELPASDEATTALSLNELKKVKTESLVVKRNQKRVVRKKTTGKKAVVKKPKQKSKFIPVLTVLMVLGAGYYNIFVKQKPVKEEKREIGKVIDPKKVEPPQPAHLVVTSDTADIKLVPQDEWPKKESLNSLRDEIKCTNDFEKYLCDTLRTSPGELLGVVQLGLTLNVLLNLQQIVEGAHKYVRFPKDREPELVALWHKNVRRLAFYHYIKAMPSLDEKMFPDMKIALVLNLPSEQGLFVEGVGIFYPHVLNKLKPTMRDDIDDQVRSIAEAAFVEFERYVSIY